MNKLTKTIIIFFSVLFSMGFLTSCEDFFNPDQDITIVEEDLYTDWYEYRAVSMGLYSLQADLVEQLVVLGELRGDLMTVTSNADEDLMEIYNFNITKGNEYAKPDKFFELIAACNRFISTLETNYPHIMDHSEPVNNYDRLYGEALTMRAWAYFNAVRIYGKVPLIDEKLRTVDEINEFINSPMYVDSVYIDYGIDGYENDTIRQEPVQIEKKYLNTDQVIRHFTHELETKVKIIDKEPVVGVNHYINNEDVSWEVTIWSQWSYHTLLGHMYLTLGDLSKSFHYFEKIIKNSIQDPENRYKLDDTFAEDKWGNIFTNVYPAEHILTLQFDKASRSQHELQRLFEPVAANEYMLKPTSAAVHKWETEWNNEVIDYGPSAFPGKTKTTYPGEPGDFYRGHGVSYVYFKDGMTFMQSEVQQMLEYKMNEEEQSLESMMAGADTVVTKYSLNKTPYDGDANFIIYRAAEVHLFVAEIYNYWSYYDSTEQEVDDYRLFARNILNDGSHYKKISSRAEMGVRGRVDLEPIIDNNDLYIFDPFTNEFSQYFDLSGKLDEKKKWFEEQIMEERARELAFEGQRFYDLMRIAKRRNDPSYLAKKVSAKYPSSMRDYVYNLLLDENNWYINYFE